VAGPSTASDADSRVSSDLIARPHCDHTEQGGAAVNQAYHVEAWREFYVMLGGSLAALTGLLFVATSLHIGELAKVPHWRIRAFSNTFSLVGLLLQSALVLVPQSNTWLGIELMAFNFFMLNFIIVRLYLVWKKADAKLPPVRMIVGAAAWTLLILSGASMVTEIGGGLYLHTAGCPILIWILMWNAWSLLIANFSG